MKTIRAKIPREANVKWKLRRRYMVAREKQRDTLQQLEEYHSERIVDLPDHVDKEFESHPSTE